MNVKKNISLKKFNSFKIDISAGLMVFIESEKDLRDFYKQKNEFPQPFLVLGGGNNILFLNDFQGTVIKIANKGIKVVSENENEVVVEVKAGEDWNDFVNFTLKNNLYGVENLMDIPGLVGSAPIQNIGAYGAEAGDSIVSVRFLNIIDGRFYELSGKDCNFGYRSSIFKTDLKDKAIIESVVFRLMKNGVLKTSYGNIAERIKEAVEPKPSDIARIISAIRSEKLPDPLITGNAGSFFKNPVVGADVFSRMKKEFPDLVSYTMPDGNYKIAAGWLIDKAGFKGYRQGNAGVHHKQALVLINHSGNATGREIASLAGLIKNRVKEKFGITLEPEVRYVE